MKELTILLFNLLTKFINRKSWVQSLGKKGKLFLFLKIRFQIFNFITMMLHSIAFKEEGQTLL